MGPTAAHPAPPSPSSLSSNNTSNQAANGTGRSPADIAAFYEDWVLAGINVIGLEAYNEPGNAARGTPGNPWGSGSGDGPWFGQGDSAGPTQLARDQCEAWCYVQQRNWYNAWKAKANAHGWTLPAVHGGVGVLTEPYSPKYWYGFTQDGSKGLPDGSSWPWPDANWNYFDTYVLHPYPNTGNTQGKHNQIYWNPSTTDSPNDRTHIMWAMSQIRSHFDSLGFSNKKLCWNETGFSDPDVSATAGIYDVAMACFACAYQKQFNISNWQQWSFNAAAAGAAVFPIMDRSYVLNTRACIMRDIAFKFCRLYKSQLINGNGVTGAPNTPDYNGTFPDYVPGQQAIRAAAGLSADGKTLGVLVHNLHQSASQSVTVQWSGASPSGAASYTYATPSITVTGSTHCPSGTIALGGSTFTRTIEAGAVYLFEIPINGGVTGSAPTNTQAPIITGSTDVGNTLTCDPGLWTGSPSFVYQWKRGGVNISGATSSTYTTVTGDIGALLTCQVTATNAFGSASVTTANFGPITAIPSNLLGVTTIGSVSHGTANPGYANAMVGIVVPAGKIYQLGNVQAYLNGAALAGQANIKAVLWSNSAGLPGVIRALWNSILINGGANPTPAAWQNFTPANVPTLGAGSYILGLIGDPAGAAAAEIAAEVGGSAFYVANPNFTTLALGDSWGPTANPDAWTFSIRVAYTEVSSPSNTASRLINPVERLSVVFASSAVDNFDRADGNP